MGKNTLFVDDAIAAYTVVSLPQTACSALLRGFEPRYMTVSHFHLKVFICFLRGIFHHYLVCTHVLAAHHGRRTNASCRSTRAFCPPSTLAQ